MHHKKKLFLEERRDSILEAVNQSQKITVEELVEQFQVSPTTIRNDLLALEKEGALTRTYGGALANKSEKVGLEPLPQSKIQLMLDEKIRIALEAIRFVEDGDTIAIGTGTPTLQFARQLGTRQDLKIVLHDLYLAAWLEENTSHSVFFIGGLIRSKFHYSSFSRDSFPKINIDKAFFTCNGLSLEQGITVPDYLLAESVKVLLSMAQKVYLLCDSTKAGHVSFAQIAQVSDMTKIIMDDNGSESFMNKARLSAYSSTFIFVP